MRPLGAAHAARRAPHDRGALIMRCVGHGPARLTGFGCFPSAFELCAVTLGAVTIEKIAVGLDARENEVPGGFPEDRSPLFGVRIKQRLAAPALEARRKLPAQVDDVIKTVVEAIAPIGRMTVRGISGDEYATDPVSVGDRNAQVPEAHIVELALELESGRLLHESLKVVVIPRGVGRHRRVKEEGVLSVNPPEEPPVALERRVHCPIGDARREALQACLELRRADDREHHELVEALPTPLDTDLLSHGRMTAVAADRIVPREHLAPALLRDHTDANALLILRDSLDRPSHPAFDTGKLGHPLAQHALGQVLRNPLARLEIILVDHLAIERRIPVFGAEIHVRCDPTQGKAWRQHARGAHLLEHSPGIEMLHGALLQPLPLWNAMLLRAPLDDCAGDAALGELDRHRHANRAAADDDDLLLLLHFVLLPWVQTAGEIEKTHSSRHPRA